MAETKPLLVEDVEYQTAGSGARSRRTTFSTTKSKSPNDRVASLDVFRGLCVFLMTFVDYAGSIFPIIAHSPWNGLRLADFVMPFFLFVAGVSLAIVYKDPSHKERSTWKVVARTLKLFLLGILLQGGFLHGITSLTYGVDLERIRWLGILQRISVGHIVAALLEIWDPYEKRKKDSFFMNYIWHWFTAFVLSAIYMGLSYGLYVPDWQFSLPQSASFGSSSESYIYKVNCSVRGDMGPACNPAGMIDRTILGIGHLYAKPVYRNLKECKISYPPSWCHAPFEPEGILSSLTSAVTCIIGLHYGHILVQLKDHKERLSNWSIVSFPFLVLGLFLALLGIPLNKSLYTISYMLVTTATAGITFSILYILIDVYGLRKLFFLLEWIGKHSLCIFVLITSNIAVIAIQGFYLRSPENNIVNWIVTSVVQK
ncbi:heparan-alpha-glucosaminide N-acetyltransferase-like [Ipomoea triloba]|uniref:heparan-alpha-glucosaminide N-acetyltransferase-like n=1 Tax=Ipomoea triloba TaxID=35885 RepID=UPI00125D3E6A|nr:heparan-alpha-glucosaminide N-acetyltransferase-like [Ipomoea triloba]